MRVEWAEDAGQFADRAAAHVVSLLDDRPDALIALPTGHTPIELYKRLRHWHGRGRVRLERAYFRNLDEYAGVPQADPHSFAAFLHQHFLDHVPIARDRLRLIQGDAADLAAEAAAHDASVNSLGGLDLAILGLGANGHIAFNEPGSDWTRGTHVVPLSEETRAANASYFEAGYDVPTHGITMGIGMLAASRRVLLLVRGESKRPALEALLRRQKDPAWPVTALIDHPDLVVVADASLDLRGNGTAAASDTAALPLNG